MNDSAQLNHRHFPDAGVWVALIFLVQPVLDILSYWLGKLPHGSGISLGLRIVILALAIILAWRLSESKKPLKAAAIVSDTSPLFPILSIILAQRRSRSWLIA